MTDEREIILLQNERFYEALETHGMAEIEALWSHASYVRCIHPGGVVMEGWETVRESWRAIMDGGWQLSIAPRNVSVELFGTLAVVVLTEEMVSHTVHDVAMVMATNIFERSADGWKIIHHHGSLMAMSEQEENAESFRYN